ncbi:MAG: right-handed parallel beta-helix repeat-containing protein, partial [Marinomonas sp.]
MTDTEKPPYFLCFPLCERLLRAFLALLACSWTALTLSAPVSAQTLTTYYTEASYDAAIPAGSTSTVEDFSAITANSVIPTSPPGNWNGFTVSRTGSNFFYRESYYCNNFNGCGSGGWGQANPPALKGIKASLAGSGFGNGQVFFTPTNPAFAFGMNHWAWTSSQSDIEVTLSNGAIRIVSGNGNTGIGFVGFKLDGASIASGITISSFRWKGASGSNFNDDVVALWNIKSSTAPQADPLIVTSTADTDTVGTLRYAINFANGNAGADTITFDIAGTGPHTITTTGLPAITDDGLTIDGLSQDGATCGQLSMGTPHTLQLFIDGSGTATNGFLVTGSNVTITGLAVGNFLEKGVVFRNAANALVNCNYLGVEPDGISASPLVQGALSGANQFENVAAGIIRNNLISGNNDDVGDIGLIVSTGSDNISILGNVIGLNAAGTTALPNGGDGLQINNVTNTTIGGLISEDRNIISGNGDEGIDLNSGSSTINILGNYIGLGSDGSTGFPNTSDGIQLSDASDVTIGGTLTGEGNVISRNGDDGVDASQSSGFVTILGNFVGTDSGGALNRGNSGVGVRIAGGAAHLVGDGTALGANVIAYNDDDGVRVIGTGNTAAIVANSIHSNGVADNGDIGIDLGDDGVTANDANDADSGANNLLNFPVLNAVLADGSNTLGYNFNLDAPSNAQGYRIDFYLTGAVDASGYGQGQTWLGSLDVNHAGGDLNFSGIMTANAAVTAGDIVSATTTRKTATSYDITSEFTLNETSAPRQILTVSITQETFDIIGRGAFDLPGNDQLVSLRVTNPTGLATTQDSIQLVVGVPTNSALYFGDIDDVGPETDPVIFDGSDAPG